MREALREPSEYLERLGRLRQSNPYAKRWVMRLERHTNKHPECSGAPWGWYEIFPFSLEVGFWGSDKDDLKGVDIDAWNKKAKALSIAASIQTEETK